MNPIKWNPNSIRTPSDQLDVNPPMRRQVVNMPQPTVVRPDMTAYNNMMNNAARSRYAKQQFDRQIARDNVNHMRKRAVLDQEYERRKKLQAEAEKKIKEKEDFDWNERGGKEIHEHKMKQLELKTNLDTMNLMNTLVGAQGGVDQMKLNNQRALILSGQIENMQEHLDAMKGQRAEEFLQVNIDDGDWFSGNENPTESGFDWDTLLDEGDISISGGPTFSMDKMSDSDLINAYRNLTGSQKIEFARQAARRQGKSFDDQVSVAEQDQQEKIDKAMELLTTMQTASPDTIRMAESNLKSYLKMFGDVLGETEMNLQALEIGSPPSFDPEIDEGMGRDATQQRSLDFSRNESAKTNSTNPVMPPKNTDYKTKEIKETNWVPDPEVLSDSMDF